eukprot:1005720-Pyramimonas_sp.AAC.1
MDRVATGPGHFALKNTGDSARMLSKCFFAVDGAGVHNGVAVCIVKYKRFCTHAQEMLFVAVDGAGSPRGLGTLQLDGAGLHNWVANGGWVQGTEGQLELNSFRIRA